MSSPSWQARGISLALRLTIKRQLAAAQGIDQVRQLMGRHMSRTPREMEIAPWPHAGGGQGQALFNRGDIAGLQGGFKALERVDPVPDTARGCGFAQRKDAQH